MSHLRGIAIINSIKNYGNNINAVETHNLYPAVEKMTRQCPYQLHSLSHLHWAYNIIH